MRCLHCRTALSQRKDFFVGLKSVLTTESAAYGGCRAHKFQLIRPPFCGRKVASIFVLVMSWDDRTEAWHIDGAHQQRRFGEIWPRVVGAGT